jgi:hypothetical protein
MPLPPDYTPGPLQVVGPKLFGNTAEFLKEQLSGQIKLPPDLTEQQLEKARGSSQVWYEVRKR